jgi:hypothetical protein
VAADHIGMTRYGPVGEVDTNGCRDCSEVPDGAYVDVDVEQAKAAGISLTRRSPTDFGEVLGKVAKVQCPVSPRSNSRSGRRQSGAVKWVHANQAGKK